MSVAVDKIKSNLLNYNLFEDVVWTRTDYTKYIYEKDFKKLEENFGEEVNNENRYIFIKWLMQLSQERLWSVTYVRSLIGKVKYNFELKKIIRC